LISRTKHTWPIYVLVAALLGLGCGGGDGGDDEATASLSKPQFVKQANAICERGLERRLTESGKYAGEHRGESLTVLARKAFMAVGLSVWEEEFEELRALDPPKGDEKQVDRIFAAFESWVDGTEQKNGGANPKLNKEIADAVELARKYGLSECSYG